MTMTRPSPFPKDRSRNRGYDEDAVRKDIIGALALVLCGCREGGCRITEAEVVDVLAVSFCEARWSAGCENPGVSHSECESHMRRVGKDVRDEAHALGLEYDEHCAQEYRDRYEDHDGLEPLATGERRCPLWAGDGGEGDACETSSGLSTCAPDLRCGIDSVCERRRDPGALGEDCADYDVVYTCEDGLTCVSPGVCAPTPGIGEPCEGICVEGANCVDEVCVAGQGRGEPCESGCGPQLVCEDEVCVDAPPAICGEPAPWPW
jgi:hypothetical protein